MTLESVTQIEKSLRGNLLTAFPCVTFVDSFIFMLDRIVIIKFHLDPACHSRVTLSRQEHRDR